MTRAKQLEPIASSALGLAKYIHQLIDQGLDREAVLERLMDPADVGARMIDRAAERRRAGAEYLGRGEFVLIDPLETLLDPE